MPTAPSGYALRLIGVEVKTRRATVASVINDGDEEARRLAVTLANVEQGASGHAAVKVLLDCVGLDAVWAVNGGLNLREKFLAHAHLVPLSVPPVWRV